MSTPGAPNPGATEPRSRRAAEPPSRGALNRGALKRGSLNPRTAEPGAAGTRARNRGTPNLPTPWAATARAPLSCPNPGDTEPGSAEPRRYRTRRCRTWRCRTWRGRASLRVDGPYGAGRGGTVGTSRCAAAQAQPRPERGRSDRPIPGSVRACFTWNTVRTVECPPEPNRRPRWACRRSRRLAVRGLGDRPDAPASHETGSRSSSCWSGTGRGAHPNRSSPGLDAPAQRGQRRCEIAVCRWPSDTGTRRCASRVPASPETCPLPLRGLSAVLRDARPTPARRPLRHAGFGRTWVGGTDAPVGRPATVVRAAWQPHATHISPGDHDRAARGVTTILPVHGAKVSRAARFPVRATRSASASGRWSPERRRDGDRRRRHAGPATGDRSRRRCARPMFHVKPHGCGSTWNIAQPCRAAARSTSAR